MEVLESAPQAIGNVIVDMGKYRFNPSGREKVVADFTFVFRLTAEGQLKIWLIITLHLKCKLQGS
ncbi:MAG: hypothetical protein R2827_08475 [Bdellovibrionales bacterium]